MNEAEQISVIKKWLGTGAINIFGRPFSGKDTQGKRLADYFDGNLVGGGEILRSNTMPDQIKSYMRTGKLIPSSDYADIVLPYLQQPRFVDKSLILSSVGRWHGEEPGVIESLNNSDHPLKVVIFLNISEQESYNRWTACETNNDRLGRHDDTEEILNIRLAEFREKTLPVLEYYRKLGILSEISGEGTRDDVTDNILSVLTNLAKN